RKCRLSVRTCASSTSRSRALPAFSYAVRVHVSCVSQTKFVSMNRCAHSLSFLSKYFVSCILSSTLLCSCLSHHFEFISLIRSLAYFRPSMIFMLPFLHCPRRGFTVLI